MDICVVIYFIYFHLNKENFLPDLGHENRRPWGLGEYKEIFIEVF